MDKFNLDEFMGGWFIGNFEPTLDKTSNFEVSIKRYKKGDYEKKHTHKIATEYTIIVEGQVNMFGITYSKNDIIRINPNESTDFEVLEDTITVVVKTPSVKDDKYLEK